MWIRNQDKDKLVECDRLVIEEKRYCEKRNGIYSVNVDNELNIYTDWKIIAGSFTVGVYSTKEKALKVLDMIQSFINNELIRDYMVFQMPLDSEVE